MLTLRIQVLDDRRRIAGFGLFLCLLLLAAASHGAPPPVITVQPLSQTVLLNDSVTFTVQASSSTAMTYQWRKNSVNISGATTSTFTIASVKTSDEGAYSVRVTNAGGSVNSSNAILTVISPPAITSQPQDQAVVLGQTATFAVTASGVGPFTYQWQYLQSNLAGATDARLVLTNVQPVQAGAYQVLVRNVAGTTVGGPAFLTVTPPPGSDQPLAQALVVHLGFDGDLKDSSGRGNHGVPVGSPNLVPGLIGAGGLNPFTSAGIQNYVTLGTPSDLSFGSSTDFTIAFWVRQPTGCWGGGSYFNPVYISNKDWSSGYNLGWVLSAEADSALGAANLWLNYREAWPSTRKDYHSPAGSFGGSPDWHHLAVTFKRGGSALTYMDGVLVNSTSLGTGGTTLETGLPVNIGTDGTTDYALAYGYWTNAFGIPTNGVAMDDLGIWRRVLSPQEVCAMYNAGVVGLDLTAVTSNQLTLVARPLITQEPLSLQATTGDTVVFSSAASGTAPAYQWFKDGNLIAGATSTSLVLSNAQAISAGSYWVVAANAAGSATSVVATLTVNAAPVLSGANNLTAIAQGEVNNAGTLVSDLIAGHVTDLDPGALQGIAVTEVVNTDGTWQYSTNGAGNWLDFGAPSSAEARLLAADASTRVRFVPAADWQGTVTNGLSFRAWDRTGGTPGGTADLKVCSVLDQFDSVSYSNDNGVTNWTAAWVEYDSFGGGASSGLIWVQAGELRIQAGNAGDYVRREVNLSGAATAKLSLTHYNSLGSGDVVEIQVSADGGSSYTTLDFFSKTQNPAVGSLTLDLTSYIAPKTRVRFYVSAYGAGKTLRLDNIGITFGAIGGRTAFSLDSASASLTVARPPSITTQPESRTVTQSQDTSFSVLAGGTEPLIYQWHLNGTPLLGATDSTLSLINVQPADAGGYTVLVTNAAGAVTSAVATLNVNALPPGSYLEAVMTNRPLAFWRLGELSGTTAFDFVGGNHALYTNVTLNQPGALATDNDPGAGFNGRSSYVGSGVSLANNRSAFTMEGWYKLTAGAPRMGLWGQNDAIELGLNSTTTLQLWTPGGGSVTVTNIWGTNSWHHVAAVGTGTNLHLYVDGHLIGSGGVATTNYGASAYPFNLGGGGLFDASSNWFNGCLDEVAFYDRALPATDIQRHYLLGLPLPAITLGSPANSATFTSPATINLAAEVVTSGHAITMVQFFNGASLLHEDVAPPYAHSWSGVGDGSYDLSAVAVYDSGSVTSSVTTVIVHTPPLIVTSPQSQTGLKGQTVGFSVSAIGTAPLGYEWRHNGTPLAGATAPVLTLTNVQVMQAGNYTVVVTNVAGAVTSAVATLTVNVPPAVTIPPQSQTVIEGQPAVFSVTAGGTAPLIYQWQHNGAPLAGATAPTLTLTNVRTTDAGDYTVVVNNSAGTVTSTGATLTVMPRSDFVLGSAAMTPGGFVFEISVPVGCTYVIVASTNTRDWIPIHTNTAQTSSVLFTDTEALHYASRQYRVMVE